MQIRLAVLLLLLSIGARAVWAQMEEQVDSNETETVTTTDTSTTSAATTITTTTNIVIAPSDPPAWVHLVRLAAVAAPIAFLLLAWMLGFIVHYRLVRREQELFPAVRGSRKPQTVPMILSAALFFIPVVLFVIFEVRSRREMALGIGGVVDHWLPVTSQAWLTLLACLVLAIGPWLFARRADQVG